MFTFLQYLKSHVRIVPRNPTGWRSGAALHARRRERAELNGDVDRRAVGPPRLGFIMSARQQQKRASPERR